MVLGFFVALGVVWVFSWPGGSLVALDGHALLKYFDPCISTLGSYRGKFNLITGPDSGPIAAWPDRAPFGRLLGVRNMDL